MVASGFETLLQKDDEIIVSALEHHSNIVPWQMLCELEKYRFGIIS
jgi:cysteine desulfurase/selenocysteine lyase